jgi:hypothetical protein
VGILVLAASAALLILATRAAHRARVARESLAALVKADASLAQNLKRAQDQADYINRAQTRLQRRLADLEPGSSPPSGGSKGVGIGAVALPSRAQRLTADPKLFALYQQATKAGLSLRFGQQYRKLGLSTDQIEKFEALYTAHDAETQELRATADAQGLPMSDPDITAVRAQEDRDYLAEVAAATGLGNTQVEQIQQGDFPGRLRPLQPVIRAIEENAAAESAPLNYDEQQQLLQIAANADSAYVSGGKADPDGIDWNGLLAQPAGVLSTELTRAIQKQAQMDQLFAMVRQFNTREQSHVQP